MEGGGERKNAESVFCSLPLPLVFSFDLGYALSRLYPLLYEAQEPKTPKNLPATKDKLILDIRTKSSKFSIKRVTRSHARAVSERRCECEGPGKKGRAEVSSASSPTR